MYYLLLHTTPETLHSFIQMFIYLVIHLSIHLFSLSLCVHNTKQEEVKATECNMKATMGSRTKFPVRNHWWMQDKLRLENDLSGSNPRTSDLFPPLRNESKWKTLKELLLYKQIVLVILISKKRLSFSLTAIFLSTPSLLQSPDFYWTKSFSEITTFLHRESISSTLLLRIFLLSSLPSRFLIFIDSKGVLLMLHVHFVSCYQREITLVSFSSISA